MKTHENLKASSAVDDFLEMAKSDLKIVGKDIKNIFGKASSLGKKAFSKKPQQP